MRPALLAVLALALAAPAAGAAPAPRVEDDGGGPGGDPARPDAARGAGPGGPRGGGAAALRGGGRDAARRAGGAAARGRTPLPPARLRLLLAARRGRERALRLPDRARPGARPGRLGLQGGQPGGQRGRGRYARPVRDGAPAAQRPAPPVVLVPDGPRRLPAHAGGGAGGATGGARRRRCGVTVRGYDDNGHAVPVAGATVVADVGRRGHDLDGDDRRERRGDASTRPTRRRARSSPRPGPAWRPASPRRCWSGEARRPGAGGARARVRGGRTAAWAPARTSAGRASR